MTTPTSGNDARDALNQSERAASRDQPDSYKEDETAEKQVEVLPIDGDSAPIRGLDPATGPK